ncbi:hypothetical protein IWZ00DRAFT_21307 [Phyllosticta capitalensis]
MPSNSRPRTCNQYTIGLITALAIELAAVNAMLDENHDPPQDFVAKDNNNYQFGRIASHNVVIASLPAMIYGKVSAATTATRMATNFPDIRFGLLIGIGGGVPNLDLDLDIRLGDVVVGVPGGRVGGVAQYDLGKATHQGFKRTGTLAMPPQGLLAGLNALKAKHEQEDSKIPVLIQEAYQKYPKLKTSTPGYSFQGAENDRLFKASYEHVDGSKCDPCDINQTVRREERAHPEKPRIHYGLIASGDSVIKNAIIRDSIAKVLRDETDVNCLCFEMEAAGLMEFPCLVVRGVSDYADSHKNDRWQRYSAITAAAFAKELLQTLGAKDVEAIDSVKEILQGMNQFLRKTGKQILDAEELERIKKWLGSPDPSVNYNRALSLRHPGTGDWLLQSHTLQTFKTANDSRFLWLHGSSGCGKTLLAASIIENLSHSKPMVSASTGPSGARVVLYFFFDFQDSSKQSFDGLLRSLIQQMSFESEHYEARKVVSDLFHSCKSGTTQPSTEKLKDTFVRIVATFEGVHVVPDALDECPPGSPSRRPILEWIFGLFANERSSGPFIKFFITSRSGQSDIESRFNSLQAYKQRLSVDSRDDIHKFVHDRLEQEEFKWLHESPETRNKAISTLMERSGNMFRLAELYLKELEKCGSPFAVEEALKIMPNDLNELYERSLLQIPSYHKKGILQLLKLILYSEVEVVIETALHFMAIDSDTDHPEDAFQERKILKDYRPIFSVLSSLVTINDKNGVLTLAHSSVKDFFVSWKGNPFDTDFSEMSAKSNVLKLLLSYLVSTAPRLATDPDYTHDNIGELTDIYRQPHDICDLLRYLVDKYVENANQDLIAQFFRDHSIATVVLISTLDGDTWKEMYKTGESFNTFRREILEHTSDRPLHAACALICADFGWEKTLKNLQDNLDINASYTKTIHPPLNLVCFSARLRIDKVGPLLKAGASPNLPGPDGYGSALLALICGQRYQRSPMEILQRQLQSLLDGGVDVNISDGEETALQELFREPGNWEDSSVVGILLRHGANPNVFEVGESPLFSACLQSTPKAVKRLLEFGASVDCAYGLKTPLSQASHREAPEGREIIDLLLNHGANVGFALSLTPSIGTAYKVLAVFAAEIALKRRDEKEMRRILSPIDEEEAVLTARRWGRASLIQALLGYNGCTTPLSTDFIGFPRPHSTVPGTPDSEDEMDLSEVTSLCPHWIESVERSLRQGKVDRVRMHFSRANREKAFYIALSRRLVCLTLCFLREKLDNVWLNGEEIRLFAVQTALQHDESDSHGIHLTAERKKQIFQLASQAGIDHTKVAALTDESIRRTVAYESSAINTAQDQAVPTGRPRIHERRHFSLPSAKYRDFVAKSSSLPRLLKDDYKTVPRWGRISAQSYNLSFRNQRIPKVLRPFSHGAANDSGKFAKRKASALDMSDEEGTEVGDVVGLFASRPVEEIEWVERRVDDGRKPFAAFDTLQRLTSQREALKARKRDEERKASEKKRSRKEREENESSTEQEVWEKSEEEEIEEKVRKRKRVEDGEEKDIQGFKLKTFTDMVQDHNFDWEWERLWWDYEDQEEVLRHRRAIPQVNTPFYNFSGLDR